MNTNIDFEKIKKTIEEKIKEREDINPNGFSTLASVIELNALDITLACLKEYHDALIDPLK